MIPTPRLMVLLLVLALFSLFFGCLGKTATDGSTIGQGTAISGQDILINESDLVGIDEEPPLPTEDDLFLDDLS